MPELTPDELSAFFAWIVDAQEFLPVPENAKGVVDKLIAIQEQLKEENKLSPALLDKNAVWRTHTASTRQRVMLMKLGIEYNLDITAGEASDLIDKWKQKEQKSADGYAEMWSDKNIAEFGNLL